MDDDNAIRFPNSVQTWGFNRAYLTLIDCFVLMEVPQVEKIVQYTLPANTTILTPLTAGISDFGELVGLKERTAGSTEIFVPIAEVDDLLDTPPNNILRIFTWQSGAFNFVGATVARDIRITFYGSGTPPTIGSIGIDQSLLTLSKLTAGYMAPRKGDPELGARLLVEAVGENFSKGIVGGDAYRLIQPMVRGRQRVQVAPRRYRAGPTRFRFFGRPFIGPAAGGGMTELTISGLINGTSGLDGNAVFALNQTPGAIFELSNNGILLHSGVQYTRAGATVTFIAPYIPVTGDWLYAVAQL